MPVAPSVFERKASATPIRNKTVWGFGRSMRINFLARGDNFIVATSTQEDTKGPRAAPNRRALGYKAPAANSFPEAAPKPHREAQQVHAEQAYIYFTARVKRLPLGGIRKDPALLLFARDRDPARIAVYREGQIVSGRESRAIGLQNHNPQAKSPSSLGLAVTIDKEVC